MSSLPPYKDRLVAFIDILGFGELVSNIPERPDIHRRLHSALTSIKHHAQSYLADPRTQQKMEASVFSDSIVISTSVDSAFSLILACGWLQAQLLYLGVLTRGGISKGLMFHQNDVLYGEGMLNAYALETTAAVYPRIVLDANVVETLGSKLKSNMLVEDADGLWFVDPFKFDAMAGAAEGLAADGYDPREIYFDELGKHIEMGIREAKNANHISKWMWLKRRHQEAQLDYNANGRLNAAKIFQQLIDPIE